MSKRQFVQLAYKYDPAKHSLAGRYASEKLDGQRAIWDGGVSRGILKSQVPYANTERDSRYKEAQVATGLWSRYANVIHAPDWFLDLFPSCPLDLELYAGRKNFQFVQSTVKDLVPSDDWYRIQAVVLDAIPMCSFLTPGRINERNIKLVITPEAYGWWLKLALEAGVADFSTISTFEERLRQLKRIVQPRKLDVRNNIVLHHQYELPFNTGDANRELVGMMQSIKTLGGEGVILKSRSAWYVPERSYSVLKYKPSEDAEGVVIGYFWGDLPDNTRSSTGTAEGKYLGMMGSLLVKWEGKEFKLSGFTDAEREMSFVKDGQCAADVGILNPGNAVGPDIFNQSFPRGSIVTFQYRELSDDGIPKEARFLRKRDET